MTDLSDLVPEHIRALGSYTPGKPVRQAERESGVRCIKLASNENPFGPSPKAVEAIRQAALEANYYPDNDTSELRLRLAELHGVQPEQTLVTNGSTSLLGIMARALLGPGKNAVTSEWSFIVYPIATKATGARFIQVPTRNSGYDLDAIAAAVNNKTRLIFLANPNNPTGTMVDASAVDAFLDKLPDHVVIALDEAYSDFAADFAEHRGVEYSHSMDYVRQRKNVVVLRTFSKAHGLAGIRVGYGIGPAELMQAFNKLRTTFSVSGVAEAAALAALGDTEHARMTIENNRNGAEWLMKKLRELGLDPVPTWANFIFFDAGEQALPLAKRIQAEGVIVRPMHTWGIPTAVRVTIGMPEQNEMFIAALAKALERSPVSR
jgi:histidinol-phosphate aminotransferase